VISPISTTNWFGSMNNSGSFDAVLSGQGTSFTGSSSGVYKGWALAGPTLSLPNAAGVTPWDSSASAFIDYYGGVVAGGNSEPFISVGGGKFQPQHLEAIGGDAVCFLLQTSNSGFSASYNTTMYQVQRSTNKIIEIFNIANYITDMVSDGASKVFSVTSAGEIYLIDTSLVPVSGTSSFLGYNPYLNGARIGLIPLPSIYEPPSPGNWVLANGRPGDIINIGTGMISIELGAGQRIATATHNGGSTTVHIFSAESAPFTIYSTLNVLKTYTVNEKLDGLAFDGGKFFYGRSLSTNKLFRFDAGL
jgi:hypothetical protein